MISNYLAPAALAKQKTHWKAPLSPPSPIRFSFSNWNAEFVGTSLQGYLRPRDVTRKKKRIMTVRMFLQLVEILLTLSNVILNEKTEPF